MELGELTLKEAAKQAAGNWQRFKCFWWKRASDLRDAEKWAVVYGRNRDSGLLDQSNASVIAKALTPFTEGDAPDVLEETHSHWACGWVEGHAIRVYKRGRITKAFREYHTLAQRLADYPVLDESDYSQREYDATLENIRESAWRLKDGYDLPDDWQAAVFSWLWDNDDSAVENVDDQGGYPTEEQLREAFVALGYKELATV